MSGLTIFILCMAVAMVIGPIMMMQPNQYQRNVAKLRAKAAQMGLRVRLEKLKDDTIPSYEKPWPLAEKLKKQVVPWRLEKMPYTHDIHVDGGYWQISGALEVKDSLRDRVKPLLDLLPNGVQAIEVTSMGVRCFWNESGGETALEAIGSWLEKSRPLMTPYHADVSVVEDIAKDSASQK